MSTEMGGSLNVPVYSLFTDSCVRVQFNGDESDLLVLQSELDDGTIESYNFVVGETGYKYGQINYSTIYHG